MRTQSPSWLLAATGIAYLLIGIEIIIMISPFALYFYAVYGPILHFLTSSSLTRWTTEFFLPHMVFLDDPLILFISYLQVFLIIGLILFFECSNSSLLGKVYEKGCGAQQFLRANPPSSVSLPRHFRLWAYAVLAQIHHYCHVYHHALCLLFVGQKRGVAHADRTTRRL